MKPADIEAFFDKLAVATPSPTTELLYTNPYTLLVAVVLSAQSTDAGVNKATKALFEKIDTPEKMLTLGEVGLKNYIKTIGLYNAKAKNIIRLSEKLVQDFNSAVPRNREHLETLPGVGRKTANVILNTIYHQPVIAVDTHVFRVANRTGLTKAKDVLKTELQLIKVIPENHLVDAHHLLILHGRYTCKARVPECWRCPVIKECAFKDKNLAPPATEAKR